ncbi:MAG: cell division protein CrgA [Frankiaceae bacterium]|jgi:hypothetical protein|nr:cell division protein CrgA [Frankiaceae bacterium]
MSPPEPRRAELELLRRTFASSEKDIQALLDDADRLLAPYRAQFTIARAEYARDPVTAPIPLPALPDQAPPGNSPAAGPHGAEKPGGHQNGALQNGSTRNGAGTAGDELDIPEFLRAVGAGSRHRPLAGPAATARPRPIASFVWLLPGLAWIVAYVLAGGHIPIMRHLGGWSLVIGVGLLILGSVLGARWRRSGGPPKLRR